MDGTRSTLAGHSRQPGGLLHLPHAAPFQLQEPWDTPGTLYFWSGPFSSFAIIRQGITLPAGYLGHEDGEMCTAYSRESYFQACKAQDREVFLRILGAPPAEAKKLGGYAVMLTFNRLQWRLDDWRELLLMTGRQTLAELSPYDAEWGCKDRRAGTYTGRNLLGICHMHVREELRQQAEMQFHGQRPFLRTRSQVRAA
jgi:predicted NAD-dependent protein-ADP-ribosyltransferase YbiA (DUF1768 family)